MLLRPLPTLGVDNLKVLRSVRITLHPYEHLRVLVHAFVVENISPHAVVTGSQHLPLHFVRQHSGNDIVCEGRGSPSDAPKSGGRKQHEQRAEDDLSSHNQNWNTSLPLYSRHASLKNSPNRGLSRSFCTSRGLKWFKTLNTPKPSSRFDVSFTQVQRYWPGHLKIER